MDKLILVFILFSVPLNTFAFVSDFDRIKNEIEEVKSQNESASYDQIEEFFSSNPQFSSHCYQQGYTEGPQSLLALLEAPSTQMNRTTLFTLFPLRYGYEMAVQFPENLPQPLLPYEQSLECVTSERGCSAITLSKSWTLPDDLLTDEEKRDPIEVKETWNFYLSEENKLYAESSFQMITKKRNWIGAPVGRETLRLTYNCALEKHQESN